MLYCNTVGKSGFLSNQEVRQLVMTSYPVSRLVSLPLTQSYGSRVSIFRHTTIFMFHSEPVEQLD